MNKTQKAVTWIGLALFFVTLLFAPWEISTRDGKRTYYPRAPIWSGPTTSKWEDGPLPTPPNTNMNDCVRWWRTNHPEDANLDNDVITLMAEQKYPDTFRQYPDAMADFNRIKKDEVANSAFDAKRPDYFYDLRSGSCEVQPRYGVLGVWWLAVGVLGAGGFLAARTPNKPSPGSPG